MLRLIKFCFRNTLSRNSVIFFAGACLLFCMRVVKKDGFLLKCDAVGGKQMCHFFYRN